MLRPLQQGDTIGICAPAGPVKAEKLQKAVSRLVQRGYQVKLSPQVQAKHGFLSAEDDVRLSEIEAQFADAEISAIISARGGVGTSRLLPALDGELIASSGKPFLSFSDVTAMQWALWANFGTVTFTGPLAVEFDGSLTEATEAFCFEMLSGIAPDDWIERFPGVVWEVVRTGAREITAPLLPGNLTMITTLLGTPFMPNLRGCILAIEDIAEQAYRVDRLLFHLRNAGVLQHLAGLLVGDFGWGSEDTDSAASLRKSVLDATSGTTYPIVFGLPYGHGPERLTLPVGSPVRLSLLESSVRLGFALSPFATTT